MMNAHLLEFTAKFTCPDRKGWTGDVCKAEKEGKG